MRQITCVAAAVLMAATLACSPRDRRETADNLDSAAADVSRETQEGADKVREETQDARDYAYAQRNDFRQNLDARLKELDREIADLERTTKRGVDKTRDSALVKIRAARKAVSRDLDRLASATESNWDEVKGHVNESLYLLDQTVREQLPDAHPMGGANPS